MQSFIYCVYEILYTKRLITCTSVVRVKGRGGTNYNRLFSQRYLNSTSTNESYRIGYYNEGIVSVIFLLNNMMYKKKVNVKVTVIIWLYSQYNQQTLQKKLDPKKSPRGEYESCKGCANLFMILRRAELTNQQIMFQFCIDFAMILNYCNFTLQYFLYI